MKGISILKQIEILSNLLDKKFGFLGYKFGLDPVLGVIPVLGDILPAVISVYVIILSKKLKISNIHINKMIRNTVFDLILGIIPVVGDVSDFFYQSNEKNLKILKSQLVNSRKYVIEGDKI